MDLDKIKKINKKLNAFLLINEIKKKGTPIAIKDNFLTKGIKTTAASVLLDEFIPPYSATVVKKLEEAGYYVLGKTNLDAWCHGSSTETSDYGPTLNPWNLKHLAGGSSGGSAAAVAAGLVDSAIGSETAGSIRGPSSWCGVTGIKPTYGRVSRYGVIAMGSSLDSPGVIAKDVPTACKVLSVISGYDPLDATSSDRPTEDFTKYCSEDASNLNVAIVDNYLLPQMDKEVKNVFLEAVKIIKGLVKELTHVKTLDPKYSVGVYTVVQRSEVSSNLARFDGVRYGKDRSAFGEEAKRRIMLGTYTLSSGYQDKYYLKAQKVRSLYLKDFEEIFSKVDLLIAPTMPSTAPKIGASLKQAMFGELADILAEPSSISGHPAISIPCGFSEGLPVGLQIIAPHFMEGNMIKLASSYQKETDWHLERPKI